MRLKKYLPLVILCGLSIVFLSWTINKIQAADNYSSFVSHKMSKKVADKSILDMMEHVYDSLHLDSQGLSHEAFEYAVDGFEKLDEKGVLKNDSILTIIDFDQPSYKKRMYVLDVRNFKVLFNTLVAHGKNTGKELAQSFSNVNESNKSSLGFYITDDTYFGSKGYSLKLKGVETNFNSNAMKRAIVVHGAWYVSQSMAASQGYIGRSHGCPAVPEELCRPIIQTIKNGSCLFIYNKSYTPSDDFITG